MRNRGAMDGNLLFVLGVLGFIILIWFVSGAPERALGEAADPGRDGDAVLRGDVVAEEVTGLRVPRLLQQSGVVRGIPR